MQLEVSTINHDTLNNYLVCALTTISTILQSNHAPLCPMELRMIGSIGKKRQIYHLGEFAAWATTEHNHISSSNLVGHLKSVHLYRSRKAPFYHEFAVLCCGEDGLRDSWLRVERAARMKSSPFMPTRDSLGPLFKGVASRDSISFALRKSDLCNEADELACIVAGSSSKTYQAFHMNLTELLMQLLEAAAADPNYRLLETNCRWFARRCVLSFAQRLSALGATDFIEWEGSICNFDTLVQHLLSDRFGGRQMAGPRGLEIQAGSLLNLARTISFSQRGDVSAEKYVQQALSILRNIPNPTPVQADLMRQSLHSLGESCAKRGESERALEHFRESRRIRINLVHEGVDYREDEAYAKALFRAGKVEEALAVRTSLLSEREIFSGGSASLKCLHITLVAHANVLATVPDRLNDALTTIQEALEVMRQLQEESPNTRNEAETLLSYALILIRLGRHKEACEITREILVLTRRVSDRHGLVINDIACELLKFADSVIELGLPNEAVDSIEEFISIWDGISEANVHAHLPYLSMFIIMWGDRLHNSAGIQGDGVEMLILGIEHEKKLLSIEPSKLEGRFIWHNNRLAIFGRLLDTVACQLIENSDPRAVDICSESIEYRRTVPETPQEGVTDDLADFLLTYAMNVWMKYSDLEIPAELLKKGIEWTEEAIDRYNKMSDEDSDSSITFLLGIALSLLAQFHQELRQIIPSLHSALLSFKVFSSIVDPNVGETVETLKSAIASWTLCANDLYNTDLAEGVLYANEYINQMLGLSARIPDAFLEAELCRALTANAVWMFHKLHRRNDSMFKLQMSIRIGRRLLGARTRGIPPWCGNVLAISIFYYYTFFLDGSTELQSHSLSTIAGPLAMLEERLNLTHPPRLDSLSPSAWIELLSLLTLHQGLKLCGQGRDAEVIASSSEFIDIAQASVSRFPCDATQRIFLARGLGLRATSLLCCGRTRDAILDAFEVVKQTKDECFVLFARNLLDTIATGIDADYTVASSSLELSLYRVGPRSISPRNFAPRLAALLLLYEALITGAYSDAAERCCRLIAEGPFHYSSLTNTLANIASHALKSKLYEALISLLVEFAQMYCKACGEDADPNLAEIFRIMHAHVNNLQALGRSLEAVKLSNAIFLLAREDLVKNPTIEIKRFLTQLLESAAECYESL